MSEKGQGMQSLAFWLLRRFYGGSDGEALAGDLMERLETEGQTRRWLWLQVAAAIAGSAPRALVRRWPEFGYALLAVTMPVFAWKPVMDHARRLPWWQYPWPVSQIMFEGGPTVIFQGVALLWLGAGLWMSGRFQWLSLMKTTVLGMLLTMVAVNVRMAVFGPPPLGSYAPLVVPFCAFLAGAWLGCSTAVAHSWVSAGPPNRPR